jgi:hypothetical protein
MKKKMGTLSTNDYFQLGMNFLFAAALVVGVSIFLQRMTAKDEREDAKRKKDEKIEK